MATLKLAAGAPSILPPGETPWRIADGEIEVYLITADRRRLIAVLSKGQHLFPLPAGPLSIGLVALTDSELTERLWDSGLAESLATWIAQGVAGAGLDPAEAPDDPIALAAMLDARFTVDEAARDAALATRLARGTPGTGPGDSGTVQSALRRAAPAFGLSPATDALPAAPAPFGNVPALARLIGMRAGRMMLEQGWWRDDIGPLVLKARTGDHVTTALWKKGAYRGPDGEPVSPADHDGLAWRLYPPLTDDVSSFRGMARSVSKGLRREIVLIAGAGLGGALLGLLTPIAAGWIFDDIVPAGAAGLLVSIGIALFVAAMLGTAFDVVTTLAISRVAGRGQTNMAAGIADRVLRLPARFFRTLSAGDFNQRLDALQSIRALVTNVLLSAGITLLFALVYLVLIFTYDVRMALAGVALTLVYIAAVGLTRMAQMKPLREAAERDGALAGHTFEILEGLPKLRSAAAEERALARWDRAYGLEREASARGQRVGNHFTAFADSWSIITLIGLFATAALLSREDIPPGQFIAFLTAFATFQGSFIGFCSSLMAIYSARPLADRARPILTAAPEAGIGQADPGRLTGDIQASGLSFGYDGTMAPLLDGLSFAVRPREHLAIVGGSGSGKSTILRLLLGFEKPLTGSLAFDGQELAGLDQSRVRAQIGVVLQSSQLFAGSINENIRGASDATLEQCLRAAERAGLAADLAGFPMGLHTPITEGAGTLSGGQRQRILIARALAADPAILFFDEATSALDNATQAIVAKTLDSLNATRITIAHRLSTVRNADRICVLEKGRFVESGSFAELMAKDGAFAALARRQLLED